MLQQPVPHVGKDIFSGRFVKEDLNAISGDLRSLVPRCWSVSFAMGRVVHWQGYLDSHREACRCTSYVSKLVTPLEAAKLMSRFMLTTDSEQGLSGV